MPDLAIPEALAAPAPWIPVVQVDLAVPDPPEGVTRGPELAGLLTVLVELGLCDLSGVVAHVASAPLSPGQGDLLTMDATRVTGSLAYGATADSATATLTLCDAAQSCTEWSSSGPRAAPQEVVAPLLLEAAAWLDKPVSEDLAARWASPVSKDEYAVLLTGRAAAVLYGLHPAAADSLVGHKRQDPITRAAFVDPFSAPAAWVQARRDADRGELVTALEPLERGRAARPESLVLAADQAALLSALERKEAARRSWQEVWSRNRGDARHVMPLARAELASGLPAAAGVVLDTLPTEALGDAQVVALRVRIADAGGSAADELLARWQAAAPADPEPVRRRLALRVDSRSWSEALAFSEELGRRGAVDEARALEMPLALALDQPDRARAAAVALGRTTAVERLEARAAMAAPLDACAYPEAVVQRACAAAAFRQGKLDLASSTLGPLLKAAPWDADTLAIALEVAVARGDSAAEAGLRGRLAQADPDHPLVVGSLVTASGASTSGGGTSAAGGSTG